MVIDWKAKMYPSADDIRRKYNPDIAWQERRGSLCRGFAIPNDVDVVFYKSIADLWVPLIIPDSVAMCRQSESPQVYVTFETWSPMISVAGDTQVGKLSGDSFAGFGEFADGPDIPGFRGPAIPVWLAVELQIVDMSAFDAFIAAQPGIRGKLDEAQIASEVKSGDKHRARMKAYRASDEERVGVKWIVSDLGQGLVNVVATIAGKIVYVAAKVIGSTAAAFLAALGPIPIVIIASIVGFIGYQAFQRL